jgi:phage terminase large subunit
MVAPVQKPIAEMSAEEKRFLTSCYGFTKGYLGLPVYDTPEPERVGECRDPETGELYYEVYRGDKQKAVLDEIDCHNARVSARTCNGAGKTSTIIAGAILWHMSVHPKSTVVYTTAVYRQLKNQLWPALQVHQPKFEAWDFKRGSMEITAPNRSRFIGFVTDDAGKAEGYHGNKNPLYDLELDDGPLMIIIDEGKSVSDPIFGAIDRCTYQRLLLASSPGFAEGEFHASQTKSGSPFARHVIRAADCPHVDHEKAAELIRKRGIDHPLVRSTIFGEFMADPEGSVIGLTVIERALGDAPQHQGAGRAAYCDYAAGGDENVIALREGNRVTLEKCWREKDTMAAVGMFIREFKRLNLSPEYIWGDNHGLGKVMIDALHESGWPIQRDECGREAYDPRSYANRSAEVWYEGGESLARREWIIPNDEELKAQLCGRKGKPDSKGRLKLESKEEMKRRGLASPDRADAMLGAMMAPVGRVRMSGSGSWDEAFQGADEDESREESLAQSLGIHAG